MRPPCPDAWTRRLTLVVALLCTAFVVAEAPVSAQSCPDSYVTGTITSGDGSTVPGLATLWWSDTPAPAAYIGSYPAGTAIVLAYDGEGNMTRGTKTGAWYASHGSYFTSAEGGTFTVAGDDYCYTCSGGFDLKLYATQGAVEGTLKLVPAPANGYAGFSVWMSRTPYGSTNGVDVDPSGHFEFRNDTEPGRSNNWGVPVDSDDGGMGEAQYYFGVVGDPLKHAFGPYTVRSSQLTLVNITATNPRVGGGGDPGQRSGGCNNPGAGGPGPGPGPGPGSGPGDGGAAPAGQTTLRTRATPASP